MTANSEARKRREQALWGDPRWAPSEDDSAREVMRQALAEVYSGAGLLEAGAVLDHLDDLGARVEVDR